MSYMTRFLMFHMEQFVLHTQPKRLKPALP